MVKIETQKKYVYDQYDEYNKVIYTFKSIKEIADFYNLEPKKIRDCISKDYRLHGKYRFVKTDTQDSNKSMRMIDRMVFDDDNYSHWLWSPRSLKREAEYKRKQQQAVQQERKELEKVSDYELAQSVLE